jgi:RND family efflux transporter MFP subunit
MTFSSNPLRLFALLTAMTGLILRAEVLAAQEQDSEPAVPITVSEVLNESLAPGVLAAGTVHSRNTAQITAGLAARLEWVAAPGAYIEAGNPVARFDCELLQLRREEQVAQAGREQVLHDSLVREIARIERARMATSEMQLERVKANRDLARGEMRIVDVRIRQNESELKRCVELAPFSGVVTVRQRRAGEDVARGELLVSMTDVLNLEVRASVPIRHLPRMTTGVIAQVRLNEVKFSGLIQTVVPAADAMSQTFEVRIELPPVAPNHVAAGQLVSVTLPLSAHPVLTVPRDSIVLRTQGTFVMRIDDYNKVESVAVEVADASGEKVAVTGNLQAGDRIAVRGAEALDDGELVDILSGP